jgi:hypothetical protein
MVYEKPYGTEYEKPCAMATGYGTECEMRCGKVYGIRYGKVYVRALTKRCVKVIACGTEYAKQYEMGWMKQCAKAYCFLPPRCLSPY